MRIPWRRIARTVGNQTKKYLPRIGGALLCCIGLLLGLALTVSTAVCDKTEKQIITVEELKNMDTEFDCILVLGCKVMPDGRMSHMLEDRVKTGIALYQSGFCKTVLMSGDSYAPNCYDEVGAMKKAAMEAGIPQEAILVDPMGLSTYESISNLSKQFAGKRILIVTQRYHLYRAVYIAEKLGMEAYGIAADLRTYSGQSKREVREIAARCKDVFFALVQP